jgi:hypothetical protein
VVAAAVSRIAVLPERGGVVVSGQRDLLKAWQPRSWLYLRLRREARWQRAVPVAGMRRFWDEMGERARDVNPETTRSARGLIRV